MGTSDRPTEGSDVTHATRRVESAVDVAGGRFDDLITADQRLRVARAGQ